MNGDAWIRDGENLIWPQRSVAWGTKDSIFLHPHEQHIQKHMDICASARLKPRKKVTTHPQVNKIGKHHWPSLLCAAPINDVLIKTNRCSASCRQRPWSITSKAQKPMRPSPRPATSSLSSQKLWWYTTRAQPPIMLPAVKTLRPSL